LVCVFHARPDSTLVAVTAAPWITAPELSETVPVKLPLVPCAAAFAARPSNEQISKNVLNEIRFCITSSTSAAAWPLTAFDLLLSTRVPVPMWVTLPLVMRRQLIPTRAGHPIEIVNDFPRANC